MGGHEQSHCHLSTLNAAAAAGWAATKMTLKDNCDSVRCSTRDTISRVATHT